MSKKIITSFCGNNYDNGMKICTNEHFQQNILENKRVISIRKIQFLVYEILQGKLVPIELDLL